MISIKKLNVKQTGLNGSRLNKKVMEVDSSPEKNFLLCDFFHGTHRIGWDEL